MSALRQQMIDAMLVRGFSTLTPKLSYLAANFFVILLWWVIDS